MFQKKIDLEGPQIIRQNKLKYNMAKKFDISIFKIISFLRRLRYSYKAFLLESE